MCTETCEKTTVRIYETNNYCVILIRKQEWSIAANRSYDRLKKRRRFTIVDFNGFEKHSADFDF